MSAFSGQGDDGDEDHAGEHAVHVEVVLRRADQQAQALVGAEDLADERADEGEAEADVQAGQDPGEGRGEDDVAVTCQREAPSSRALAMRLRSTSRAPWKALKKTPKKTRTTARMTLDWMPKPKATVKIEPRMMRGIELAALRNGREELGEQPDPAEGDAADDAEDRADDEAEDGLLEGDEDLVGRASPGSCRR